MRYSYQRVVRTPGSEQWLVYASDNETKHIGTFDLHIAANGIAHGTLVVTEELTDEQQDKLITNIDDDIVDVADLEAGNFILTVYKGQELGHFKLETKEE